MRYQHDCDKCEPLGEFNEFDLYYCTQNEETTYVARFSSAGPDYISGVSFIGVIPAITEAHARHLNMQVAR